MKNYTPHDVVIRLEGGEEIRVPAESKPLHLSEADYPAEPLEWADPPHSTVPLEVPAVERSFHADLPYPGGAVKIVSLPVLMALAETGIYREDLYAPDTGKTAIRDSTERIEAVTRLIRLHPREDACPWHVQRNTECLNYAGPYETLARCRDEDVAKEVARALAESFAGGGCAVMVSERGHLPGWGVNRDSNGEGEVWVRSVPRGRDFSYDTPERVAARKYLESRGWKLDRTEPTGTRDNSHWDVWVEGGE